MTLSEAIKHCEEVAEKEQCNGFDANTKSNCKTVQGERHYKCAEEHRQLADWLKELKAFRQIKTKILKAIEELREDAKYHAYPIQDNTEMVIFEAEMALNIIDNKHN